MATLDDLTAALADRYRVQGEIGRGGMATVYLAEDLKHRRQVAIKVFHREMAAAIGIDRFLREVEVEARLQHPHILMLIDSGTAAGQPFYVMPYVDGESLRDRLKRERQLAIEDALQITTEIAGALEYAHRQGVIHRDVKPDNIMFSDGHAVLLDFGIAHAVDVAGDERLTASGLAIGTPAYMSPEQSAGDQEIDGRSDVYSLAAVLYEMLVGEPPFTGATAQAVAARQYAEPVRSICPVRPAVSPALDGVVTKALAKVPADRYDDPKAFAAALAEAADAPSVAPPPRVTAAPPGFLATHRGKVAAAVLVIVLLALYWWSREAGEEVRPGEVSPSDIAVLPFSVRGGADIQYLGEGVANLLSTKLDGAGELRSVDSRTVLAVMEQQNAGTLDPAAGRGIAERFGAGLYVLGDVLQAGDRLRISATLYDLALGQPRGDATVEGQPDAVFALVDSLAAQLLLAHSGNDSAGVIRIASVTTASLPALKAYLEGEAAYRSARYSDALEAFQRAVDEDSLFALAHYRLSLAGEWALRSEIADAAAADAVRHAGRLSSRDRRLLEAYLVRRTGNNTEAERLYRSILGTYPDDLQAWLDLGEILFHANPLHGRPFTESRESYERILSFDPDHSTTLIHMSRIAARERKLVELDSLASTFVALAPSGERALEILALQVFTDGTAQEREAVLQDLSRASDLTVALAVWDVAVFAENLPDAVRIAELLTTPQRSAEGRRLGHAWLAHLLLAGGRWDRARREIARIEDPGVRLEYEALLALVPFRVADAESLTALRDRLRRLDPDAVARSENPSVVFNLHDPLHQAIRLYLLGLVSARLGDTAQAAGYAAELERLTEAAPGTLTADFAGSVRAEVHRVAGRPGEALAELSRARRDTWYGQTLASPYYAQVRERFTQAELLFEQGRLDEALRWYRTMMDVTPFEAVYAPVARLRQGQIHQARGDTAAARRHYVAFVDEWREADAELQPLVADARERLADLSER